MNTQTIENFSAFAKLYGYIRFFYPGDEAASVDWNKFAVYGMHVVETAQNPEELKSLLTGLFYPIAPAADIFLSSEYYEFDLSRIIPEDTIGLLPVAWQHKGLELDDNFEYKSVRVNRIKQPVNTEGSVTSCIDAVKYRGKEVRLKGIVMVWADGIENFGKLLLKAENKSCKVTDLESKEENRIASDSWVEKEITVEVPFDAEKLYFGCVLHGEGMFFTDNVELDYYENGKWNSVKINNPDFENDEPGGFPKDWEYSTVDYKIEIMQYLSETGKQKCLIRSIYQKKLFDEYPMPGEYFVKSISGNLSLRRTAWFIFRYRRYDSPSR